MKRAGAELFFNVILVPVDYLMLILAGLLAYFLRFQTFAAIRPIVFELPFKEYLWALLLIALGWLLIFALAGLYTIGGRRKKFDEFKKILLASSAGFAAILTGLFFSRELFSSRFIILVAWLLAIILIAFGRLTVRAVEYLIHRCGLGNKKIIIIGDKDAQIISSKIKDAPGLGYDIVGVFASFDAQTEKTIKELLLADEIIFAKTEPLAEEVHQLIDFSDEHHIALRYSADLFATHAAKLEFDAIAGIPLMEIKRTRLDGWGRVYKRIFDIVGSLVLIIIFSPVLILAALAIVLETGFPTVFRNERMGLHGKKFATLKFRSMYQKYCIGGQFTHQKEALAFEEKLIAGRGIKEGPVYKIKNDPRVTRVGRFLRRLSLDELPQLFNVLAGQMSLIGPRPHQPREVEKYEKHHRKVFNVRPGITGLAQISGRSDLGFEDEIKLDTFYIEHWSLKLDFIILLKTPFVVLFSYGAY